ncbi:YopX family protein [Enterococcus faecalis]|uniref:YopX family protein n=1 Tax=Enterococcus faecalis TaxID=1351 RepID=UPI003CC65236
MIPKFRAWDKNTNDMVDVKTIDLEKDGSIGCIVDYNGINLDVSECILMQSTGLKDKNGVEIFEGDVLYYIPFESHINDSIVVFEKGSFCKKMLRNGKLTSVKFIDSEEYEVIGNIHENPELLEGTK